MAVTKLHLKRFVSPPNASHFAVTRMSAATPAELHTHDFVELFWIESGHGWHWINGQRRPLHEGMLVWVRADDRHAFSTSGQGAYRLANLAFAESVWRQLHDRFFPQGVDWFAPQSIEPREFALDAPAWSSLQSAANEIRSGARDLAATVRFLMNVTYLLKSPATPATALPAWLARACREIEKPEHFSLGTKQFCELAGRSPPHVARAVRQHLKQTPTDLVNAARLNYAAAKLATSDESILDIALDCGLENLGHFYKLFREKFAMSPMRYRLAQQQIVRP